jgi:hypothetical protein
MRGGANLATIRADLDTGAEVVALDGEQFRSLVSESKPTWEALNHVAEERIAENTNGRNGANHA